MGVPGTLLINENRVVCQCAGCGRRPARDRVMTCTQARGRLPLAARAAGQQAAPARSLGPRARALYGVPFRGTRTAPCRAPESDCAPPAPAAV